jgi:hypothetical protein
MATQPLTVAATPPTGTPTTPPAAVGSVPGHNSGSAAGVAAPVSQATMDAWLKRCAEWGEKKGSGDASLTGWYQDMVQSAFRADGIPATKENAQKGYEAFMAARRKKAGAIGKNIGVTGNSKGARFSEAFKMLKLGALPLIKEIDQGGLGVFNRAIKIINTDPEIKGEVAKAILKVATQQFRQADKPLDDDQIKDAAMPKVRKEKEDGDVIYSVRKTLNDNVKLTPNVRSAINSLGAELEAIHYKTAQQRRLEEIAARKTAANKAALARKKKKA